MSESRAMPMGDIIEGPIWRLGAKRLAGLLREGNISSEAAVLAALTRIGEDPLQAFITVAGESALEAARAADKDRAAGRLRGPLHGMPVAIKDLAATKNLRTTFGSARFADFLPPQDEPFLVRLRKAGAIVIGKTNTPEFGFGAICANRLAGPTGNPWDPALTSGGSSGGSAVAVTTGMAPLAHGTDFGGSVRTPASFCGCVGLRPTPGLVAEPNRDLAWNTLATHGVMARNVEDAALFLAAMVSADSGDPTSRLAHDWVAPIPERLAPTGFDPRSARVAISSDLGGSLVLETAVEEIFVVAAENAARHLSCVSWAHPDCSGGEEAFKVLRAAISWHKFKHLLAEGINDLTDSFVWNVEQGRAVSAQSYLDAEVTRGHVYRAFGRFFADHDFLLLPSASVLPFANAQGEVHSIGGKVCETIIDYLAPTFLISLVGYPAISVPALWTDDGRPFGIQIVGRPCDEAALLAFALHLQEEAGFRHRWPG